MFFPFFLFKFLIFSSKKEYLEENCNTNLRTEPHRIFLTCYKDYKFAFLDTAVLREPNSRFTTSVYRKPTHTDQYLAYDSHHPQSVKRSTVNCLYERAKRLVTKPSVISEEKRHLSSFLVSNGYLFSFLQKLTKTAKRTTVPNPPTSSKLLRFTLCQRSVRTASPLPTTTRRTRCFQVGDYAKTSVSTTKRLCRPG